MLIYVFPLIFVSLIIAIVVTISESDTSFVPLPSQNVSSSSSSSSSSTGIAQPDNYNYVIVGAGQSNMQGYGPFVDNNLDSGAPGLYQYVIGDQYSQAQTYSGYIVAATESLQDNANANYIGPMVHLGNQYLNQTGKPQVILIQSGIGSTSSTDWLNSHLTRSINAIKAVNNSRPNMKVAMIAWHQGESDSPSNSDPVAYYNNMVTIINRYRTEAPGVTATTPFLIVSMVAAEIIGRGESMVRISDVHRKIPNYIPYTAFRATPMGMQYGCSPSWDRVHFGATGQRINGRLYMEAYKQALLNTQPFLIPNHPTNVALNGNVLSWTNTNATSYSLIYRTYLACNDYEVKLPTILPLTSNPQTINVFTPGQAYQYDVLAYNNGLHSSQDPIWKLKT